MTVNITNIFPGSLSRYKYSQIVTACFHRWVTKVFEKENNFY